MWYWVPERFSVVNLSYITLETHWIWLIWSMIWEAFTEAWNCFGKWRPGSTQICYILWNTHVTDVSLNAPNIEKIYLKSSHCQCYFHNPTCIYTSREKTLLPWEDIICKHSLYWRQPPAQWVAAPHFITSFPTWRPKSPYNRDQFCGIHVPVIHIHEVSLWRWSIRTS